MCRWYFAKLTTKSSQGKTTHYIQLKAKKTTTDTTTQQLPLLLTDEFTDLPSFQATLAQPAKGRVKKEMEPY